MKAKPILRQNRVKKPFVKRNEYVPGFVYMMADWKTTDSDGKTLVKVGFSGHPPTRLRYLEKTWGKLELLQQDKVANKKWLETWMHQCFNASHEFRTKGLDGYTEFFRLSVLEIFWMRIVLHFLCFLINLGYVLAILAIFALLAILIF
jgi:hypothetical protein